MNRYTKLPPAFLVALLGLAAALPAQTLRATHPDLAERSLSLNGGQVVTLSDELVPKLLAAPVEKPTFVVDWPLAPGVFQEVFLTRREVYAPAARIYAIGPQGQVEVPRSRLALFGGGSTDGKAGVWLSIDPETGELAGNAEIQGELYTLRREAGGRYAVATAKAFLPTGDRSQSFGCADDDLLPLAGSSFLTPPSAPSLFPAKALATLHTATIAVDTDNEAMLKRFSDNTTTATDFIAQLFTAMNVMYERDLKVRLLQGTTFLRLSTVADPYSQPASGGSATVAQLNEFSTYWNVNNGSIPRALAMMLSGKLSSGNSFGGIGWINGLCSTSVGYSFSQIFNNPAVAAALNSKFVGHELGHNFGSQHTHCYSPPADNCANVEAASGCFSGTPTCPATSTINGVTNVQGTVMSYCHGLSGCSSSEVFHPRTLDIINPILATKVGICVFPATTGATASKFFPLPPCRLIDTRNPAGALGGPALAASGTRAFTVTGTCGIPTDAKAISGNLTVVVPAVAGFLNAYATGSPNTLSLVSFRAAQIKANNVFLKLPAAGGSLTFQNGSAGLANFLLDVNGYFK